jgi:hypothetical protein
MTATQWPQVENATRMVMQMPLVADPAHAVASPQATRLVKNSNSQPSQHCSGLVAIWESQRQGLDLHT